MPAWLVFLLSAAAVILAGFRLAHDGDIIADRTGLGRAWVGAILVAAATSLPELTTDLFATWGGHPNLAAGDLFGSGMANMLILALGDLLTRGTRVFPRVAVNQALVGAIGIGLTTTAILGAVSGVHASLLGFGWPSIAIGLLYLGGMRVLHQNRAGVPFASPGEKTPEPRAASPAESRSLGRTLLSFGVAALVILIAARYLASSAVEIADQLGVATGFIGVLLVAVTTSMPEAAVSVASIRAGSYDLAVGNLVGSNCFNMAILIPMDFVDGPGSIFGKFEPNVLAAGAVAVILIAMAIVEILNRSERRIWKIEPGPAVMVLTYLAGLWLVYPSGKVGCANGGNRRRCA